MSSNKKYFADIPEEDIITLEFDEDGSIECAMLGVFEYKDKEYMSVAPLDDTDDIYIYEYIEEEDGEEFELADIEDEALFEEVVQEFENIMKEMGEEDAK